MKKILVNFAHPMQSKSVVNLTLKKAIEDIDGVTINDLYSQYPDFMIDVESEQQLCESHDVIVFQHPFYWYSTPSIIKEWMDLVLEHDWAYGKQGKALSGKTVFQTISTGGDANTYQKDGVNKFTIAELTSPFKATMSLCKMSWLPPFVVSGIHRGLPAEILAQHAKQYRQLVTALRDDAINTEQASQRTSLNSDLSSLLRSE